MLRYLILAAAFGGPVLAQPPIPVPQSAVDGRWFFRGNPFHPCSIQSIATPAGPRLVFTNENGTPAEGWLSRDGRRVTIPDWNLVGRIRANAIVWPNGDFLGGDEDSRPPSSAMKPRKQTVSSGVICGTRPHNMISSIGRPPDAAATGRPVRSGTIVCGSIPRHL